MTECVSESKEKTNKVSNDKLRKHYDHNYCKLYYDGDFNDIKNDV